MAKEVKEDVTLELINDLREQIRSLKEMFYVNVEIIRTNEKNPLPVYKTIGAGGMDLYANLAAGEELTIGPKEFAHVDTGIKINIPMGYEVQIWSRSGLAFGDTKITSYMGTIDTGYLDTIKVQLHNEGKRAFVVKNGDRIAQMKLALSPKIHWSEVDSFGDSFNRGGGFGSTGV